MREKTSITRIAAGFVAATCVAIGAATAQVNAVNPSRQVQDTIQKSVRRQFSGDAGGTVPGNISGGGGNSIGNDAPGPGTVPEIFNLPRAPDTAYIPPPGGTGPAPPADPSLDLGGGGGGPNAPVRICAVGWVDSMNRPVVGVNVGMNFKWSANTLQPDFASFGGVLTQGVFTADPQVKQTSFNWIGGQNYLNSLLDTFGSDTFGAQIQINTNQTTDWLLSGPSGNCGALLSACMNDQGSAAVGPDTISTMLSAIGGPNCVLYYQSCQPANLMRQGGTSFMTSEADPQGTSPGGCQTFPTAPTCSQVLPLFQQYAQKFSCTCQSSTKSPVCTVFCPNILQGWQADVGPTMNCSCSSPSAVGAPSCVQNCLGKLPSAQQARGDGYTCSCPSGNAATAAPTCQQNCGGLLPTYQAQFPSYTCSCPTGKTAIANPVCVRTCGDQAQSQQSQLGPNYTCSCQDPSSLTETPSCQLNCGGLMATNPSYQSNASQYCSCPSGPASISTPSCVPTCGSQIPSTSCPTGQVAYCPNGNTNPGTPVCQQQTCGQLQPAWACPSGRAAFCPDGQNSLTNPVCLQTCGSKKSALSCPLGQLAVCTAGDSNPGDPVCQQQTCGSLKASWSCGINQVAYCPNGDGDLANPVCTATCGSQLSSWSCPSGQTPYCPNGNSNPGTPACQQQTCGTLLPTWTCQSGYAATCPNGNSDLSNPVCKPKCSTLLPSTTCPAGQLATCTAGPDSTTPPTCVQQQCGSLLPTWSCPSGQTASCPSGNTSLSNPVCSSPSCGSRLASWTCPSGSYASCGSLTSTSPPTCVTPFKCSNAVTCSAGKVGTCGDANAANDGKSESCVTVQTASYTGQSNYFTNTGVGQMCAAQQWNQKVSVSGACGSFQLICARTLIDGFVWVPYYASLSSTNWNFSQVACLYGATSANYYAGNGLISSSANAANGNNCVYAHYESNGQLTGVYPTEQGCP